MRHQASGVRNQEKAWARLGARLGLLALTVSCFLTPVSSSAQDIVDVLRRQRTQARMAEVLAERGPLLEARPLAEVGEVDRYTLAFLAVKAAEQAVRDSVRRAEDAKADSLIRLARLASLRWRKVEPDAQGSFLEQYADTYWQAALPGRGLLVDTSNTALLRGRLQAAFGRPTRNGDAQRRYGYGGSEYIQFEYWFVVNDSIPLLVLDIDGPFGTGLLIASDEAYAGMLAPIKAQLSARLDAAARPVPWLDYYHSFERGRWYRTGYNGVEQYTVEVRPPRWSARAPSDRWIIHR